MRISFNVTYLPTVTDLGKGQLGFHHGDVQSLWPQTEVASGMRKHFLASMSSLVRIYH